MAHLNPWAVIRQAGLMDEYLVLRDGMMAAGHTKGAATSRAKLDIAKKAVEILEARGEAILSAEESPSGKAARGTSTGDYTPTQNDFTWALCNLSGAPEPQDAPSPFAWNLLLQMQDNSRGRDVYKMALERVSPKTFVREFSENNLARDDGRRLTKIADRVQELYEQARAELQPAV